jgi:CheY-like chemotaxis protein
VIDNAETLMLKDAFFLYVEDDELSREVMQMLIEQALGSHHLVMFEDSADFMARLRALPRRPDVILLDVHVQPYDGFEMLNFLRHDPAFAEAQVIALTASVMSDETKQLRDSGFDGMIAKPLSVSTFPDLIERILNGEAVWYLA